MDTLTAFYLGMANRGHEEKVFDWDKAAQEIKSRGATSASAGLIEDWGRTAGGILRDGKPIPADDTYTFLSSTWATPILRIDGENIECYKMQSEAPNGLLAPTGHNRHWISSMLMTPLSKVLNWVAGGMQPPHPRSEIHQVLGKPMRKILVTGASGRLGQALQRQQGFDFIPISGVDLSNFENTAAVISGCGPLDCVVTLAGGWAPDDQQDPEKMMSMNFLTALNAVGASIETLKNSRYPRIVMIGAASALTDQTTPYNQAKNAVHNLAKMLAKELPPKFKVNVIAPTQITDYDYVAQQIVKLLQPNNTQTGEIFIV